MSTKKKLKKGFTLVEILVVVGLIAILATITIVAINPTKNFRDTRNTTRRTDVAQILSAINQYLAEQGNTITSLQTAAGGVTIPSCTAATGPTEVAIGQGTGNLDLDAALVDEFIPAIPEDPSTGSADNTGYTICLSGTRVQIEAAGEGGVIIEVK